MSFEGQAPAPAPAAPQGPQGGEGQGEGAPQPRPHASNPEDAAGEYYKRMEAITRKEREMVEQRKRWQSQEQKYKEMEEKYNRYESIRNGLERDPEALLRAYDLDVEKYSKMLIDAGDGRITKEHLSKYDDELNKVKTEFQTYKEQQEEERLRSTYDRFHGEAASFIDKNAEKYPLLSEEPEKDSLVFETIQHVWETTKDENGNGRFLSIEEACDLIDKNLANQYMAALKSEKRRKALGLTFAEEQQQRREEGNQYRPNNQEPPRTISNRYSNQSAPPMTKREYTAEERAESIKRMLFSR